MQVHVGEIVSGLVGITRMCRADREGCSGYNDDGAHGEGWLAGRPAGRPAGWLAGWLAQHSTTKEMGPPHRLEL